MIVSVTDNSIWINSFAEIPPLRLPEGPVLVVAPHPDDETLGVGTLIAMLISRHIPVTVVAVTDGENAYDTDAAERAALGLTRVREQEAALSILGVKQSAINRFKMTDSGLAALENTLTDRLRDLAGPGVTLIAPWSGDFHPDHEVCARAAITVARDKGLPLISYFFWTWHRGSPSLFDGLPLRRFDPEPHALAAKASALSMHHSQLERLDGEPILPDRLLGPARWPFEVFLQHE